MDTKEFYKHNEELKSQNANINKEMWHFNWGAFGFGWIWGLFNGAFRKTFLPWILLTIYSMITTLPDIYLDCAFLVLMIYYGIRGNTWAWNSLRYDNVIRFKKIQRMWAIAAVVEVIVVATTITLSMMHIIPDITNFNSSYVLTNRAIIREITKDNTLKFAPDGEYVATQIVERYNSKTKTKRRRYGIYNRNIIVLKKYNPTVKKYEIEGAILFSKQIRCSLKLKNCSIAFYKNENNKFIMKEKIYYDHKGKTLKINYEDKK
ncbi:hypothetical protein IKP85_07625 [bacterium]|nr:hypothetical protein [bacterium]